MFFDSNDGFFRFAQRQQQFGGWGYGYGGHGGYGGYHQQAHYGFPNANKRDGGFDGNMHGGKRYKDDSQWYQVDFVRFVIII